MWNPYTRLSLCRRFVHGAVAVVFVLGLWSLLTIKTFSRPDTSVWKVASRVNV